MIIELDCGNTRIKWRQLDAAGRVKCRGCCNDLPELEQLLQAQENAPGLVRYCTVRGGDFDIQLAEMLQQYFGTNVLQARSQRQQGGLTNAYPECWRLGSDRWLVMLAGYHRCADNCVIIDCGTAITVDFIRASGLHLGGVIAPGLRLLQHGLSAETALKPALKTECTGSRYGDTTAAALAAGVSMLCEGFFNCQAQTAFELFGADYKVIMTGGDADALQVFCPHAQLVPELLFEGLAFLGAETGQ